MSQMRPQAEMAGLRYAGPGGMEVWGMCHTLRAETRSKPWCSLTPGCIRALKDLQEGKDQRLWSGINGELHIPFPPVNKQGSWGDDRDDPLEGTVTSLPPSALSLGSVLNFRVN